MNDFVAFLWIVIGIVLSIFIPVASKTIKEAHVANSLTVIEGFTGGWFDRVLCPYLKLSLASFVLGFLTLAFVKYNGGQFADWPTALFTGYLWDSTIQKIK
ncbi:MAG: hypothetical protein OEL87_03235 [Nanoarchaeota archaeon]|nr:hypothetical protein [Nanoarchaeota archaeon]